MINELPLKNWDDFRDIFPDMRSVMFSNNPNFIKLYGAVEGFPVIYTYTISRETTKNFDILLNWIKTVSIELKRQR